MSSDFKSEGNAAFQSRNFLKALQLYTLAIKHSSSSELLPILYGNRSACTFHLGFYQECLTDIERCLEHYPQEKLAKIINRKQECLVKLKKSINSPVNELIAKKTVLKLVQLGTKGRGLICDDEEGFEKGQILLKETPIVDVFTSKDSMILDSFCSVCYSSMGFTPIRYCLILF